MRPRSRPPRRSPLFPYTTLFRSHLPSGRMTAREEAEAIIVKLQSQWELDGLGPWMVRRTAGGNLLGHCGCSLRGVPGPGASHREPGAFWNLGYRFRPEVQGQGLATSVSREDRKGVV